MNSVYWQYRGKTEARLVDNINGIITGYKRSKIKVISEWKRKRKQQRKG